jgi:hypothetical protein
MSLRFRRFSEVVMAWLVGAVVAVLVFMWPTSDPCPHGQTCPSVPMPAWQILVGILAFAAPGFYATRSWIKARNGRTDESLVARSRRGTG